MATVYKVRIEIEECDETSGDSFRESTFAEQIGHDFKSFENACDFAEHIVEQYKEE